MSQTKLISDFRQKIAGGLVTAPLAGTSDPPWLRLLAGEGIAAFWTEMVSADGLYRGGRKTLALLTPEPGPFRPDREPPRRLPRLYPEEGVPVVCQLFGHLPEAFAHAARLVELCGYDAVDLNYGCPARKVVRSVNGVALMRDLPLAAEIAAAALESTSLPVTAKMRLGYAGDERAFLKLAAELDQLGVAVLTLHPRTKEDGFGGTARWPAIAELVEAVGCPVIGNGDVKTPEDARRLLDSTGCRAVMVGRALVREPWQARRISRALRDEEAGPGAGWPERLEWTRRHGRLLCEFYGERRAMFKVRRFALFYLRGVEGAGGLRRRMAQVASFPEFEQLLDGALDL